MKVWEIGVWCVLPFFIGYFAAMIWHIHSSLLDIVDELRYGGRNK